MAKPVVRLPVTVIAPEGRSLHGFQLVFRRGHAIELAHLDPRVGAVAAPAGTWRVVALSEVGDLASDGVVVRLTDPLGPARRVCEPGNALHAAGLRTGDAIIGLNGEEFGNRWDLDRKLEGIGKAGRSWLIVVRGSERLDLELPDSPIADPRAESIVLTPVRR